MEMYYEKNQIDLSKIPKIFETMGYGESNYEIKNGIVSESV